MSLQTWLQYLVDAVSVGALYALMALALALLFSVMGLMNFAFGEVVMVSAYAMYYTRSGPWPLMIVATIGAGVVVSLLMERVAFRPLRRGSAMTLLIASLGVSIGLQALARMIFGTAAKGIPPFPALEHNVVIGGVAVSYVSLLTAFVTLALLIGLSLLLRRTTLGVQLRASTEDFRMARMLGVRADRVIASAFAITGVLGAVVALLLMARSGGLSPSMGLEPALIAFIGAVLGGLGSIGGATLGGFVFGAFITLLQAALPESVASYTPAIAFSTVMVILIFRPEGIVGPKAVTV